MIETDRQAIAGHAQVRDRVAQVYLGMVDWGPNGNVLRRRIDWMAEQAQGPSVLDVGCSEGIVEVLLARRGVHVTGVETNSEALDFARELLDKEPEEVRTHATLIQGDFIGERPVTGQFDTVVLGEILEHLHDPKALLDRSLEHLQPEGRIVITTPFGLLPHEDHHQTFCLTNLIDLLKPRLSLEHLSVEDGYIRFVGNLSGDRKASWRGLDADVVVSMTETALVASQTKLYEMLAARGSRLERLEDEKNRLEDRKNASWKKIQDLERQVKLDRVALAQHKIIAAQLKENLKARDSEARVLKYRLEAAYSSTSFLAGSTLVQAAKQPRTIWKLPFRLLRLYRSASKVPARMSDASDWEERYKNLPTDLGLDVSQFVGFPPLSIPESTTQGPRVAAILDTFTEYSLRYEANLLLLSRENWRRQIEEERPALLLVESAWMGNDNQWQHQIVRYESLEDNPLRELLEFCRSLGIPTMFWNKEDPPHFDEFIGAAREFDFVFTSDADCIPLYRRALGHDRIYALPFAAQPRLHNPSREEGWPNYPVCFAGSWMQHKYPERADALSYLLDPTLPLGLHIFDRNLMHPDLGPNFRFPDKYKDAIKGTLTYEEMLTAYRCYDVLLNVNTVTESPTMFSRRVLESLACGTPVISSESVGMSRLLRDHVRVARGIEDTADHLLELLRDEEARAKEGHLAYRYVHENHTYRHRMKEVFRRTGLEALFPKQPTVSVLMPTKRPENVARCLDNFKKQSYAEKELILILNNALFDLDTIRRDVESVPNVQVLHVDGRTTLGDCLNRGVDAASGEYIAKMDDDDHYGEHYLSDSVLAASFSDAEIVGKGLFFVYFEGGNTTGLFEWTMEHTFMTFVTGGTLLIKADVFKDIHFESISVREDTDFQRAAFQAGCRTYSGDRYNYIRVRKQGTASHSDQTPDDEFLKRCRAQTPGLDFERVMI